MELAEKALKLEPRALKSHLTLIRIAGEISKELQRKKIREAESILPQYKSKFEKEQFSKNNN